MVADFEAEKVGEIYGLAITVSVALVVEIPLDDGRSYCVPGRRNAA